MKSGIIILIIVVLIVFGSRMMVVAPEPANPPPPNIVVVQEPHRAPWWHRSYSGYPYIPAYSNYSGDVIRSHAPAHHIPRHHTPIHHPPMRSTSAVYVGSSRGGRRHH